jgi:hypothetical protein
MLAPDDAAVRREADGARDEHSVQPAIVHSILEVCIGRLHHLQRVLVLAVDHKPTQINCKDSPVNFSHR